MGIGIPDRRDFLAGLFFIMAGVTFFCAARSYRIGSMMRVGPGAFPSLVVALLAGIGVLIAARALCRAPQKPGAPVAFSPLLFVLGAVSLFALLVEPDQRQLHFP